MGIRIHKVLGYGLTDLKYDRKNFKLLDERINPKSPFLYYCRDDEDDDPDEPSTEDYLEWLEGQDKSDGMNMDRWVKEDMAERKGRNFRDYHISDCIHHQPEFGMPNVLVIRPLSAPDWSRYDDSIDYVESTYLHDPRDEMQANTVRTFLEGVYPYSADYMDKRTGEKLKDRIMVWHRAKNGGMKPEEGLDLLAVSLGFKDHAEALENVRATIPEPIESLCKFLKVFTDDKYIRDLQPMVYTYWS